MSLFVLFCPPLSISAVFTINRPERSQSLRWLFSPSRVCPHIDFPAPCRLSSPCLLLFIAIFLFLLLLLFPSTAKCQQISLAQREDNEKQKKTNEPGNLWPAPGYQPRQNAVFSRGDGGVSKHLPLLFFPHSYLSGKQV